jgi:hypothetical protein
VLPVVPLLLSRSLLVFSNDLLVLDTTTNRPIASIHSARCADGRQLAERPVAKTCKVCFCAGFRTPVVTRSPHARRPASEKRQGTKSRGSGAPVMPRALWGFSRGVRLGRVGRNCPPRWLCLPGEVWMTGGTRGAGGAEENWQCSCEPIELPAVSGGSAGREPAGMASVTGLADRW